MDKKKIAKNLKVHEKIKFCHRFLWFTDVIELSKFELYSSTHSSELNTEKSKKNKNIQQQSK